MVELLPMNQDKSFAMCHKHLIIPIGFWKMYSEKVVRKSPNDLMFL